MQQLAAIVYQCRQCHMVTFYINTTTHTVCQTFGLLKDFFQHEVRITALLNLSKVDIYSLYGQILLLAQKTEYFQFFTQTNHSDIAIFQINYLVCIFNDWAGI